MAEFLSETWVAELDAAARAAPVSDVDDALVVEARISGGPSGDATFHLAVTSAGPRVLPGPADAPMVTVVTDYDTALALHRGDINAQRALAAGRLTVHGDLAALGRSAGGLAALGDLFGPVRAQTAGGSLPR